MHEAYDGGRSGYAYVQHAASWVGSGDETKPAMHAPARARVKSGRFILHGGMPGSELEYRDNPGKSGMVGRYASCSQGGRGPGGLGPPWWTSRLLFSAE